MTWRELVEGAVSVSTLPKRQPRGHGHTVPKKVVETLLRAVFFTIADKALHGERVPIPGFGVFYRQTRKTRLVRNPQTHQLMQLPASVSVGFHTSKAIKR